MRLPASADLGRLAVVVAGVWVLVIGQRDVQPGHTSAGSFVAVPLDTVAPSWSITRLSGVIALSVPERPTEILRGLAFSATGITRRSTPS